MKSSRLFRWIVPVAGTLLAGALLWGVYDRLQALETVDQALRERLSSLRSGSPTDILIRRTELLSEGIRLDGTALRAIRCVCGTFCPMAESYSVFPVCSADFASRRRCACYRICGRPVRSR